MADIQPPTEGPWPLDGPTLWPYILQPWLPAAVQVFGRDEAYDLLRRMKSWEIFIWMQLWTLNNDEVLVFLKANGLALKNCADAFMLSPRNISGNKFDSSTMALMKLTCSSNTIIIVEGDFAAR